MTVVPMPYATTAGAVTLAPSFQRTGNAWIDLVGPAADLASKIAATEFVPEPMRNKPAAIAACILYGAEIGIGPMQALSKVDIVKGRPAPRAELARALALAAGHELWVDESTNTRVKVSGRRRNSDHVMSVTWTMDDVKKAGIANQNYAKYPRQMLLARASAELVRQLCPDALGGISLFAEEADDLEPATPADAPLVKEKTTATTRTRSRAPAAAALPASEPALPGEEEDDANEDKPTKAMTAKAMALFGTLGIVERADRLKITAMIIDREVGSWNDCNRSEASKVIETLVAIEEGRAELQVTGDDMTIIWPDLNTPAQQPLLPGEDE